jgi:hypothetical protein
MNVLDNGFILVDFPFVFCLVLIAIASRFAKSSDPKVPLNRKFYSLLAGAGLLAAWYALVIYLAGRGISLDITLYFVVNWFVAFLMVSHWPYRQALLSASATTILLMLLLVAGNGLWEATTAELVAEVILMTTLGAAVIFVARPSVFTRQICFLLFIVGALLAVNELSKLGVTLQPPKA